MPIELPASPPESPAAGRRQASDGKWQVGAEDEQASDSGDPVATFPTAPSMATARPSSTVVDLSKSTRTRPGADAEAVSPDGDALCDAGCDSYACTLPAGHVGEQHEAWGPDDLCAVWTAAREVETFDETCAPIHFADYLERLLPSMTAAARR